MDIEALIELKRLADTGRLARPVICEGHKIIVLRIAKKTFDNIAKEIDKEFEKEKRWAKDE